MDQLWTLATTWYSTRLQDTRGVLNPMRCVPSSPRLAWEATFGIRSRIVLINGFAPFRTFGISESRKQETRKDFGVSCFGFQTSELTLYTCSQHRKPLTMHERSYLWLEIKNRRGHRRALRS